MIGEKFGRLTVINTAPRIGRRTAWECKCECGNIKHIREFSLKNKTSTSCGCYAKELHVKQLTKHGKFGSPEYEAWSHMIQRCTNSKNKGFIHYGGRGISITESWFKFENFFRDMGHRPVGTSLDRIDVNGNYSKTNCRWADHKTQQRNRRNNKLNKGLSEEIKNKYSTGLFTQYELAKQFLVCESTINKVVRGLSWN